MRIFALLLLLVLGGGTASAQQAGGKALYDRLCVACHGPLGLGDGAAAKEQLSPAQIKELVGYIRQLGAQAK